MTSKPYDVSVVVPFGDDEDHIGRAVRSLARYLREAGYYFELICVDEDSRDNSHAMLGLLKPELPELKVIAAHRGRGYAAGTSQARGTVLWLISPTAALQTLSPYGGAHRRVTSDELDLVVMEGRFSVCRRTKVLELVEGMRGGPGIHERLAKRAYRDLRIERHAASGGATNRSERPWSRLFETGPVRLALSWIDSES